MKNHFLSLWERSFFLLLAGLLVSFGSYAQNITVKGIVKDANLGDPVIGASVLIKGTTNGTITDMDGQFVLEAPKDAVLAVSYIGYKPQEIPVAGQTSLIVSLSEDVEALDEVVVVGYTTGNSRTISGAVQKIKKEDMNAGVVNNPLSAIKGKVAGVVISKVTGDPSTTPSIRVRGTTSLSGGNDPLVVIDGVFGDLNMLNAIAPADIETFTILKDASETAQYGSRGASGVIVVTTAKGKAGTVSLSYNGTFGVETVYKNMETLDAGQFRSALDKYGLDKNLDFGSNTDFIKEMERTGFNQNHSVSFGAGNEKSNYRASVGIISQDGIIKESDMRNYTAKLDATQWMFDNKLKIEFGTFASKKIIHSVNDYQKTFYSAASSNPTLPKDQNADGTWPEDPNANEIDNPLGRLTIQDKQDLSYINAHGKLTYTILEGLTASAFGSYTYNTKTTSNYIPRTVKQGIREGNGKGEKKQDENGILMGNINLQYKKAFGKHNLDVLALMEGQKYMSNGFSAVVRGFGTDYFKADNLKAGALLKWGDSQSYINQYTISSFLGRFNYMYDERYIATVNLRADGSSKLGSNNKWGFFPSGSVAWIASSEGFLKDIPAITNLKFRAGYGLTGNQDAIEAYNSLLLMEPTGITTVNGQPSVTYGYARNANPDLKWETKKTFDVGIDFGLFENRLSGSFDYYNSRTTGLLYKYAVPVPPFLYKDLLANMGKMGNNGVELSLSGDIVRTKDIDFKISANVSFQQNELLSLSGNYMGQELSTSEYMQLGNMNGVGFIGGLNCVTYQMVGQPVGVFYLPKTDGLRQNEKGQNVYNTVDINQDGVVDINEGQDRYIAGQAMPKAYLGMNLSFRYKRFDIQMQANGAFGHKIYNGTALSYMNMGSFPTYNVLPEAPEANIYDNTVTDYWLERGDYMNIDYITLGYTVNTEKFNKYVKSLRITASVNNVATITGYSGLSPLINSTVIVNSNDLGTGDNGKLGPIGVDDKRFYPLSRTFSIGLSINF